MAPKRAMRRPGARPPPRLRRPAHADEEPALPRRERQLHELTMGQLKGLNCILLKDAVYYGRPVQVFTNAEEVIALEPVPDELARLREAAQEDPNQAGQKPPKDSKKRKKEDKKDKREVDGRKELVEDLEEEEPGQKSLEALYNGTGLDPDAKRRGKVLRRARRLAKGKKKKKKKRDDDSSSENSSTGSSSSSTSGGQGGLFTSEKKVKQVWRRFPGSLTAVAVGETKNRLLTATGSLWNENRRSLPPLFCQYARQHLLPNMAPAMGQEVISVSMALDLLLEGRPSACADISAQRLKALEGLSRGFDWSMTRQYELVRVDQPGIADEAESYQAAKSAKEEEKLRSLMNKPPTARAPETGGKGKKGREGKGSGKYKGEDSGKGKSDGKRDNKEETWQKKK